MKILVTAMLVGFFVSGMIGCDGAKEISTTAPKTSVVNSRYTTKPPVIDGVLNKGEWPEPAFAKQISYINNGIQETHDMIGYFANDEKFLYAAIIITNEDFESDSIIKEDTDAIDVIEIYFDGNNNGVFDLNEDIQNFWNISYGDWHYGVNRSWLPDKIINGEGKATHTNKGTGNYIYEFKIPLNSGDAEDLSVRAGDAVGIRISYREMYYYPEGRQWVWSGAEDGWPERIETMDRFDVSKYGKLTLGKTKTAVVSISPEQQLAEKFAPILWLAEGEFYGPKPVRVITDNSILKKRLSGEEISFGRPFTLLDLYNIPDSANLYLDIKDVRLVDGPAIYAQKYRNISVGYPNTVYARVVILDGKTIIQYWLLYFFNDGPINIHEGDWELIQIIFSTDDLRQLLDSGEPELVTYSQHFGGKTVRWKDVTTLGRKPQVYVAKGSHANYFLPGNWAFGTTPMSFDIASGDGKVIVPKDFKIAVDQAKVEEYLLLLLPETDQDKRVREETPWLTFQGLWGEWSLESFLTTGLESKIRLQEGPLGPAFHDAWKDPIKWAEGFYSKSK